MKLISIEIQLFGYMLWGSVFLRNDTSKPENRRIILRLQAATLHDGLKNFVG